MVQQYTKLNVADNTGAKKAQCVKILGGTRRRYGGLGDWDGGEGPHPGHEGGPERLSRSSHQT